MLDSDWHERFLVQSKWTEQLRQFLYQQVGINDQSRILEVGCGTGVITDELKQYSKLPPFGIDINFERLQKAGSLYAQPCFSCSDAYQLPFPSRSMDFVVSHFLFLWLKEPLKALQEMLRVLKPGGIVAALAEPDHLARIDNPQELWELGGMQTKALIDQGANPMMGRMLPGLLSTAGVTDLQYGVSGFQASPTVDPVWLESEWRTLRADLVSTISPSEIDRFCELDRRARQKGSRVLWVPTFYAYGKKSI